MKKLNSTAKLILIILEDMSKQVGSKKLWPTNEEIATRIERGHREVGRNLRELETNGLLKIDFNPRRQPVRIIELV